MASQSSDLLPSLLSQLSALLFRFCELKTVPIASPPQQLGVSAEHLAGLSDASLASIRTKLRRLRVLLVHLAKDHSAVLLEQLLSQSEVFQSDAATTERVSLPGTQDTRETVDEFAEDTAEFWLLEAIKMMLEHAPLQEKASDTLVGRLLAKLHYTKSPAVRYMASQCVGVMSRSCLGMLTNVMLSKLATLKKDSEFRQFVSFQRSVKLFQFGFQTTDQTDATLHYLGELLRLLPKLERGVIRRELCETLEVVFRKVMGMDDDDHDSAEAWSRIHMNPTVKSRFFACYHDIYQAVIKWSKKPKHVAFTFILLQFMVCFGDEEMYRQERHFELLQRIMVHYKDKSLRSNMLDVTIQWIRDVNKLRINEQIDRFSTHMGQVLSSLIMKKTPLAPTENQQLHDIIVEISRKSFHFVSRWSTEVLTSNQYTSDVKALVLQALGAISREFPSEIAGYNDVLFPIVVPLIEEVRTEPLLTAAALKCFPRVKPPSTKLLTTVDRVGKLVLSDHQDTSYSAMMAMLEYMSEMPGVRLVESIRIMVKQLSNSALAADVAIKAFTNAHLMLTAFTDYCSGGNRPDIDPRDWHTTRVKLEGVLLLWVSHHEPWARQEALRLLDEVSQPIFKALEPQGPEFPPFVSAALRASDDASSLDEPWAPELEKFLCDDLSSSRYATAISHGVACLMQFWVVPVDELNAEPDRFALWRNHLRFMCLAMRSPSTGSEVTPMMISDFFRSVLPLIHLSNPKARSLVIECLKLVHVGLFGELLRTLKLLEKEREEPRLRKQRRALPSAEMPDYYLHESALNLLAGLLARMNSVSESRMLYKGAADLISAWHQALGVVAVQSARTRGHIASVLHSYLSIGPESDDDDDDGDSLSDAPPARAAGAGDAAPSAPPPDDDATTHDDVSMASENNSSSMQHASPLEAAAAAAAAAASAAAPSAAPASSTASPTGFPLRSLLFLLQTCLAGPSAGHGQATLGPDVAVQPDSEADLQYLHKMSSMAAEQLTQCVRADDDQTLCNELLSFLLSLVPGGRSRVVSRVEEGLSQLLHVMPDYFSQYLRGACQSRSGDSQSAALSHVYASALVTNFLQHFHVWVSQRRVHIAKMLVFSIVLQGAPEPDVRLEGLRLAKGLAKLSPPLEPGFFLNSITHGTVEMSMDAACQYSSYIASNAIEMSHFVAREILFFAEFSRRTDYLLYLARAAAPWLRNLGRLLSTGKSDADCQVLLHAMLDFHFACYRRQSDELNSVCVLHWQETVLFESSPEPIVPSVVTFLLGRAERASGERDALLRPFTRMLLRGLSHTEFQEMVIAAVMSHLRHYSFDIPLKPEALLAHKLKQSNMVEPLLPRELVAMQAMVDIVFVHDSAVIAHLAPLLLNTLVLFATDATHLELARSTLSHLVNSLAVRMSSSLFVRERSEQFRQKYFAADSTPFSDFPFEWLDELVEHLLPHKPDLREALAQLSIQWALASLDDVVVLRAVRLVRRLNRFYDDALLVRLAALLDLGLARSDDALAFEVLELFSSLNDVSDSCWKIVAQSCLATLRSDRVAYSRHALQLLRTASERIACSTSELLRSEAIWQFALPNEPPGTLLDQRISVTLLKLLTRPDLVSGTLWLLEWLAKALSEQLATSNTVVALLVLAIQIEVMTGNEAAASAGRLFCSDSGFALDEFTGLFAPDHLRHSNDAAAASGPSTPSRRTHRRTASVDQFASLRRSSTNMLLMPAAVSDVQAAESFMHTFTRAFTDSRVLAIALLYLELVARNSHGERKQQSMIAFCAFVRSCEVHWDQSQLTAILSLLLEHMSTSSPVLELQCAETMAYLGASLAADDINVLADPSSSHRTVESERFVFGEAMLNGSGTAAADCLSVCVLGLAAPPKWQLLPVTPSASHARTQVVTVNAEPQYSNALSAPAAHAAEAVADAASPTAADDAAETA